MENLKPAARTGACTCLVYVRLSGPLVGVDLKSGEQRFRRRLRGKEAVSLCYQLRGRLFSSELSRRMYGPHIVCKSRNAVCDTYKSSGGLVS